MALEMLVLTLFKKLLTYNISLPCDHKLSPLSTTIMIGKIPYCASLLLLPPLSLPTTTFVSSTACHHHNSQCNIAIQSLSDHNVQSIWGSLMDWIL